MTLFVEQSVRKVALEGAQLMQLLNFEASQVTRGAFEDTFFFGHSEGFAEGVERLIELLLLHLDLTEVEEPLVGLLALEFLGLGQHLGG